MNKFTFKTEKETGRYASFYTPTVEIKLNKIIVGAIDWVFPHKINLMIMKDENHTDIHPNCPWMWIKLKKEFNSVDEAKEFIRTNNDLLQKQFNLIKE